MKKVYKRPAIQEAIFEAKFDNIDNFDAAMPGQVYERIREKYPLKQDIKYHIFSLGVANENFSAPKIQNPLLQAKKEDGSELVQVGPGIAVANRIKYSSWEDFTFAIKTILDAYISITEPLVITRLGVRYINSFIVPKNNIKITDYFNVGVQIPSILDKLEAFDWAFVNLCKSRNQNDFKLKTRLFTASLLPNEDSNKFLLDLDCYTELSDIPRTEKIISLATQAHDEIISKVFEEIITDSTRELMEVIK